MASFWHICLVNYFHITTSVVYYIPTKDLSNRWIFVNHNFFNLNAFTSQVCLLWDALAIGKSNLFTLPTNWFLQRQDCFSLSFFFLDCLFILCLTDGTLEALYLLQALFYGNIQWKLENTIIIGQDQSWHVLTHILNISPDEPVSVPKWHK